MTKSVLTAEQIAQLQNMQLTPEQIAQLTANLGVSAPNLSLNGFDINPMVSQGTGMDHAGENTVNGYMATPTGTTVNGQHETFGAFDPSGKYQGVQQGADHDMSDFWTAVALAAGPVAAGYAFPGAAATGAGSAAAGPGDALWGMGLDSVTGGGGALEAMGTGAGAAGGGATMGGYGAGSSAGMAAPAGLGAASSGTGIYGAGTAGAGSLLSGITGNSNLLGTGATLLGGLLGSKGQQSESSSTKTMDPRLAPYVYGGDGQTGLLQYAQQTLDRQMAPGYLQGYDDMRSVGQGLLNQPIAGNGYGRVGMFPGNYIPRGR